MDLALYLGGVLTGVVMTTLWRSALRSPVRRQMKK